MYDFFVSHSSADKNDIVDGLVNKLQTMGYEVWYDKNEILAGDDISNEIQKGLSNSYCLLIVFSNNFMKSHWTLFEAGQFSVPSRKKIVPIIYGASNNNINDIQKLLGNLKYLDGDKLSNEELVTELSRTLMRIKQENPDKIIVEKLEQLQRQLATYETVDSAFVSANLKEYIEFLDNHRDFLVLAAKKIVRNVLIDLLERKGYKSYQNENMKLLLQLLYKYSVANKNIIEFIEFVLKLDSEQNNSEENIEILNQALVSILQYYINTKYTVKPGISQIKIAPIQKLTYKDFVDMYEIDQKVMRKDLIAEINTTFKWYTYNNYTHVAVRDTISNKTVGYFSVLPITDEVYRKILEGDFQDKDFNEDSILQYNFSEFYKVYIAAVGIDPHYQNTAAFIILYNALIDMFIFLAQEREIFISEILAEASTKQGEKFCKMVGMKKITHTLNDTDIYKIVTIPPEFRLKNNKGKELYKLYKERFEEYKDYFDVQI